MRALNRRQLSSALLLPGAVAAGRPVPAPLLLPDDVLHDTLRFVDGRDARRIRRFDGPGTRRDVVEPVLVHLALQHADLPMRGVPTLGRLLIELRGARGALSGTSYQAQDLPAGDPLLRLSAALVRDGETEVGLYTTVALHKQLRVRAAADLADLSAVCSRDWRADWQALQALGLRELLHVPTWTQMVRMVAAGRAQLLLAPFQPHADLALYADGLRLLPLPGIKVGLPGSRHLLLSTRHPAHAELAPALDAGIAELHDSGLLRRAYAECGFFNPRVADWRRL